MKNGKNNDLIDRRAAAAQAKTAQLAAYRAAQNAAEPAKAARAAERMAIVAAREERHLARARLKLEEQERLLGEAAKQQAALAATVQAETEAGEKERIARGIEDEAARKADRDRRYANRKARQD